MTLEKTLNGYYLATFHGTIGYSQDIKTAVRKAWESWKRIEAMREEIDTVYN